MLITISQKTEAVNELYVIFVHTDFTFGITS